MKAPKATVTASANNRFSLIYTKIGEDGQETTPKTPDSPSLTTPGTPTNPESGPISIANAVSKIIGAVPKTSDSIIPIVLILIGVGAFSGSFIYSKRKKKKKD